MSVEVNGFSASESITESSISKPEEIKSEETKSEDFNNQVIREIGSLRETNPALLQQKQVQNQNQQQQQQNSKEEEESNESTDDETTVNFTQQATDNETDTDQLEEEEEYNYAYHDDDDTDTDTDNDVDLPLILEMKEGKWMESDESDESSNSGFLVHWYKITHTFINGIEIHSPSWSSLFVAMLTVIANREGPDRINSMKSFKGRTVFDRLLAPEENKDKAYVYIPSANMSFRRPKNSQSSFRFLQSVCKELSYSLRLELQLDIPKPKLPKFPDESMNSNSKKNDSKSVSNIKVFRKSKPMMMCSPTKTSKTHHTSKGSHSNKPKQQKKRKLTDRFCGDSDCDSYSDSSSSSNCSCSGSSSCSSSSDSSSESFDSSEGSEMSSTNTHRRRQARRQRSQHKQKRNNNCKTPDRKDKNKRQRKSASSPKPNNSKQYQQLLDGTPTSTFSESPSSSSSHSPTINNDNQIKSQSYSLKWRMKQILLLLLAENQGKYVSRDQIKLKTQEIFQQEGRDFNRNTSAGRLSELHNQMLRSGELQQLDAESDRSSSQIFFVHRKSPNKNDDGYMYIQFSRGDGNSSNKSLKSLNQSPNGSENMSLESSLSSNESNIPVAIIQNT